MGELEAGVEYLKAEFVKNRRALFWLLIVALLVLLIINVREVATLLFAAYGIALLLDPVLDRLETKNISRTVSLLAIGAVVVLLTLLLIGAAVPAIIAEYTELVSKLPDFLTNALDRLSSWSESLFGVALPNTARDWSMQVKEQIGAAGLDQVGKVTATVVGTLLKGYSLALTLFNLFLLPFFVFYIARDLDLMHAFLGSFLTPATRSRVAAVGGEILQYAYAFFKGQLTVCLILSVLYIVGLSLAGMPWAFVVGTLAGMLNIVPYLGVLLGFVLSLMITLASDPSTMQFVKVLSVFGVVQLIEGNWLTPKIVGESVGIHPLGVMVALIVGGQLFGLLGLILAIPAAASIGVLYHHTMSVLDSLEDPETVQRRKKRRRK